MYQLHPNRELRSRFEAKPFQGAAPSEATFLFVGLDANYAEDLGRSACFDSVLQYHDDGVAFWRRHGVHHPFLLPTYHGDGRRYHLNFARIGFTPKDADKVSFVELLHVPTFGRNPLAVSDLSQEHLRWINRVILKGKARHIFVSAGVERLMRESGAFDWIGKARVLSGVLPVLDQLGERSVYRHLHFSNYGKFQRQMDAEARAILALLR